MSGSPLQRIKSAFGRRPSRNARNEGSSSNNSSNNSFVDFDEPPLTPLKLHGYKSSTKHRLMSTELADEIRQHVPSLLQIKHDWQLLYSIEQSGTSIHTLYSNCAPKAGENTNRRKGYILIVQDSHKGIFGAYVNDYFKILDGKYYYGNGDCFLWKAETSKVRQFNKEKNGNVEEKSYNPGDDTTQESLNIKVFPYTSVNDFIIYSNSDFISVGSGDGKFGLWIDSNLEYGASDRVETFGNEPLSFQSKFRILGLEIWKIN